MFLWFVYQSSAEVLPTNWSTCKGKLPETPFLEDDPDNNLEDERLRLLNGMARAINTRSTDVEVNLIGPGTFLGPRRSLMHARRADLFWEYRAYCAARSIEPCSYSSFTRVSSKVLRPDGHLRFRKASEHAQCDQCYNLREKIRTAKNEMAKLEAPKDLQRHHMLPWLDRQIYWSFRSMSQTYFASTLDLNQRPGVAGWEVGIVARFAR